MSMGNRWRRALVAGAAVVIAVGGLRGWSYVQHRRDARDSSSCANHFIQIRLALQITADEDPAVILPATSDTRAALVAILRHGGYAESIADSCPESYRRSQGIGYVYVGDGLRLGDVTQRSILIVFCPAESHRRSSQHGHAWCGDNGLYCVKDNAEMIRLLVQAIERGESGDVPYSARAMAVLRDELSRRQVRPNRKDKQ